jgi:nitrile hydratase accessory protein
LTAPEPFAADPAEGFAEPWQAQAFAMTLALHQRGLFTWPEWAAALGAAIAREDDYYTAWLAALEGLLAERGVAAATEVDSLAAAWSRAAAATPHGMPIVLENDPQHRPAG